MLVEMKLELIPQLNDQQKRRILKVYSRQLFKKLKGNKEVLIEGNLKMIINEEDAWFEYEGCRGEKLKGEELDEVLRKVIWFIEKMKKSI